MNQQQKHWKIMLIGDSCLDVYQYGTINRISPESSAPIFVPTHRVTSYGMTENVNENLKKLGAYVYLVTTEKSHYSIKTRYIVTSTGNHVMRVDEDKISPSLTTIPDIDVDAIVISDYNKGFVTYELMEDIIKTKNVPIFIDTKKQNLNRLEGAFVKINELEYSRVQSICSNLIVTRGQKSVIYGNKEYKVKPIDVIDVCGAGDTFLAALAIKYLDSDCISTAIEYAIMASSITVRKIGTYAPCETEIMNENN